MLEVKIYTFIVFYFSSSSSSPINIQKSPVSNQKPSSHPSLYFIYFLYYSQHPFVRGIIFQCYEFFGGPSHLAHSFVISGPGAGLVQEVVMVDCGGTNSLASKFHLLSNTPMDSYLNSNLLDSETTDFRSLSIVLFLPCLQSLIPYNKRMPSQSKIQPVLVTWEKT